MEEVGFSKTSVTLPKNYVTSQKKKNFDVNLVTKIPKIRRRLEMT
jgi:hypothetical protein